MKDEKEMGRLESLRKEWEDTTLKKVLQKNPERKEEFLTNSQIPIKRVYTPVDLHEKGFNYEDHLSFPGSFPFTRGINPTMYRGDFWLMGQYGGFGTAQETNERFKYLIGHGVTALTIAMDLPSQMGLDPDHPLASGEVGRTGVSISSLRDMETVFKDIELTSLKQVGTIANAIGPVALAWFLALAEKKGVAPSRFIGFLQNEILKEYVARGAYFLPVKPGVKLVTDVLEYCARNLSNWFPIMLCGYHFREAGATAIQELALTLSNTLTYIDRVIERGLHPDDFVPQFVFFFSVSMDLFEEVAKFRAFRRLWAKMMKERYGVKKPESMQAKLHVYTGGSNLTAQQPLNNIVRVTCEALGAVLSGVQYLFLSSMDEALQTPSEEAVMVAIRTQQIIANELNVTSTVDPLAGSYYVESLTFKIEEEVLRYLKKIEDMGGSIPAIESGFFQSEIAREGFRYQEELEKKERIKVGVNEYMVKGKAKIPPLRQDEEGEQKTIANIRSLKSERDNSKVKEKLDDLRRAAERDENVIIPTMEAVKAYATLGEICDVYRAVYGTFKEELAIY